MRRSRRLTTKKASYANSDGSNEDEAKDTKTFKKSKKSSTKHYNKRNFDGSSSESDIENYLQAADKLDLNSDFFQIEKQMEETKSFDDIENNIFAGVNRLSDSESENDFKENEISPVEKTETNIKFKQTGPKVVVTKYGFQQLQDYAKKLEETKKAVQKYEAKKQAKQGKQKLPLKTKQAKEEKLEVSQLLSLCEAKANSLTELDNTSQMNNLEAHSDSETEDWEEVEEGDGKEFKNTVPKEGVQLSVELPGGMRKKKGVDLMASIKRRLNRIRKENQVLVHKVHLLCWIAHGNFINKALNNKTLLGMALSLVPSELCHFKGPIDLKDLEDIVKWYQSAIKNIEKSASEKISLLQLMELQICNKKAFSKEMLVYIFVCMLRSLGIECRIVFSFQVAPLRPPENELHSLSTRNKDKNKKSKKRKSKQDFSTESEEDEIEDMKRDEREPKCKARNTSLKEKRQNKKRQIDGTPNNDITNVNKKLKEKPDGRIKTTNDKNKAKNTPSIIKNENTVIDVKAESKIQNKNSLKTNKQTDSKLKSMRLFNRKTPQLDGAVDSDDESLTNENEETVSTRKNIKRQSRRKKSLPTYAELDSDEDFVSDNAQSRGKSTVNNNNKLKGAENSKHTKSQSSGKKSKTKMKKTNRQLQNQNDSDSDYTPESIKSVQHDSEDEYYETTEVKAKPQIKKENTLKVVNGKKGLDVWVEVYLEIEEKWINIDVVNGQTNCVSELYSRASHPVTYIVAWNNNNTIKDVTQRYCPNCNTVTRKLRIDKDWWEDSIRPFQGEKTVRNEKEDEDLTRMQLQKPLPTTISEYKNHPLYVLKRHILKFQALYPPEPIILGFIRDEAVYPRECVYTLHSRDIWIKQAKVVKPEEKPYKIVTKPVYDKVNKRVLKDQPLEVFGQWQVQDYEPPTAINGIVPRNEYGNVDLFKPCMLPKGTVHIKLEALNKLARKMGIDCASAIVGFDVHHGWIHPVYDGYIVCEENAEVLIAAWHMEKEEREKREIEKREKRVYGNWKKLIKGLFIRERLNERYNFVEPATTTAKKTPTKKRKLNNCKVTTKKRRVSNKNECYSDDGNE